MPVKGEGYAVAIGAAGVAFDYGVTAEPHHVINRLRSEEFGTWEQLQKEGWRLVRLKWEAEDVHN